MKKSVRNFTLVNTGKTSSVKKLCFGKSCSAIASIKSNSKGSHGITLNMIKTCCPHIVPYHIITAIIKDTSQLTGKMLVLLLFLR